MYLEVGAFRGFMAWLVCRFPRGHVSPAAVRTSDPPPAGMASRVAAPGLDLATRKATSLGGLNKGFFLTPQEASP